jgi:hypothetical protein
MSFVNHFWKLLSLRGIEAMVTIQPKIEWFRYEDNSTRRRKLAEDCYNRVSSIITADANDEEEFSSEGSPTLLCS